jgi:hypothetical protein
MKTKALILLALLLRFSAIALAHPTGNMITVGEHVLWSYINPINDPEHHACIMIWDKNSEPNVFIQSEFSSSDYMLYNNLENVYIIERKYLPSTQEFELRVLKTTIGTEPKVIWDWFKDEWRVGEGGFFMLADDEMVFGKHPGIYKLKKGGKPINYFEFDQPIRRIRAVENKQILLLGENACFLTEQNGTLVKQWNHLVDNKVKDAPLNRNQIFDADYKNGILLFAYWGNRSFELIDSNGKRQTLIQQYKPFAPHWVAFLFDEKLLFSSKLVIDGSTPKPHLILKNSKEQNELIIWD